MMTHLRGCPAPQPARGPCPWGPERLQALRSGPVGLRAGASSASVAPSCLGTVVVSAACDRRAPPFPRERAPNSELRRGQQSESRVVGGGAMRLRQGEGPTRIAQGRRVGGLRPKLHSLGGAGRFGDVVESAKNARRGRRVHPATPPRAHQAMTSTRRARRCRGGLARRQRRKAGKCSNSRQSSADFTIFIAGSTSVMKIVTSMVCKVYPRRLPPTRPPTHNREPYDCAY